MQIFYSDSVNKGEARFGRNESGHCLRVLRMRRGDTISFTDGKGNFYQGLITEDNPSAMAVSISSVIKAEVRPYKLHVAISPVKNDDRLEWFIEKAVETGIDQITPLICNRTEKRRIRKERLEGLIISAMKQSVKSHLPELNDIVNFNEFVTAARPGARLIACCDPEIRRTAITGAFSPGDEVTILIGPEGDFSSEEVTLAIGNGFTPVHLGNSRLRTETAGIMACCSVYLSNL
ncbi:MAG: 16S rRNA (uracil(1498)-N(3))-methyltransferase [Bacteroidales bacterium]